MSGEPDTLRQNVASSIVWASGTRIVGQMLNWAMTIVVIRFLTPADYGLMALVTALTGFLAAMTSAGFYDALVQARDYEEPVWRRTFGFVLLISVALAGVLCLLAPLLATLFDEPRLVALLRVASLSFIITAPTSIARARLDRDFAFKQTARVDMLSNIASGVLVLALALAGAGVWALMAGLLAGNVFSTTALWLLAPFRRWPAFSLDGMRPILRFSAYRTAEQFVWYITSQVDVFLVGKLLGERPLGVYAVSRTIAALPVNKIGAIVRSISSTTFARLQDDRARAVTYLLTTMRMLAFIFFPVFFGMAVISPNLVNVLLGDRWHEATLPLAIQAMGMAARPAGLVMAPFLMALGEVRYSLINTTASLALFTVAYSIGSHWGLLGVCVAGALAYPVQFLFLVRRIAGVTGATVSGILGSLLRPLMCSALMVAAVEVLRLLLGPAPSDAERLPLAVFVAVATYGAASLIFSRDTLYDLLSLMPGGPALAAKLNLRHAPAAPPATARPVGAAGLMARLDGFGQGQDGQRRLRILLVSFWFPPTNEIGAVRAGKLAAFLRAQGHDVRVLTGPALGNRSLPQEVPDEAILRVNQPAGHSEPSFMTRGAGWLRDMLPAGGSGVQDAWSWVRQHYYSLRYIPDKRGSWRRPAVAAGMRLLATWRPDLILASAPPFTGLLVAAELSRRSGVAWIAELRDPWTCNPYIIEPMWRRWLDRWLEQRTLSTATALVTVSPPVGEDLKRRYRHPVATVLNGYSAEDLPPPAPPRPASAQLSIVYTGAIYTGLRDPSALFAGLALLGPRAREVEVTFYGPPPDDVMPLARQHGVERSVAVHPGVPYKESLRRQAEADVLLLMQRNHPTDAGNIPAKIFEYLAARRPILLLGYESGLIAGMIRDRRAGAVANTPQDIAALLLRWLEQKPHGIPQLPASVCQGLSRAEQFVAYEAFLREQAAVIEAAAPRR